MSSTTPAPSAEAVSRPGRAAATHPVRPLAGRGRRALVDGHPICETCGRAVRPDAAGWHHARQGAPPWQPRIPAGELLRLRSFGELARRFPWAVRPEPGAPFVATEADWREAAERLRRYRAALSGPAGGLGPRQNPYLDIVRLLLPASPAVAGLLDITERRRELIARFAWAVPNDEALAGLVRLGPLLEPAAGSGYWAALVEARGGGVAASDVEPSRDAWTAVARMSALQAVRAHRDRTLFLCWPPLDDDDASYLPLRAYRGDVLALAGEPPGGATGSARFHRELVANWTLAESVELPRWPGVSDSLTIWRRNPQRRRLAERDRCYECGRFLPTGSIGRCDACFRRHPPAIALRSGRHRLEYPPEAVAAMPTALRAALEASPSRIR